MVRSRRARRDPFYDAIRSVALVRVVAWHATGLPWLTWIVAAMPAMFFTAGAMLPGGGVGLLRRRLRRVLVPLWVYGGTLAVAGAGWALWHGSPLSPRRVLVGALRWLVPLADPPGAGWQHELLTSHLWYLRAYLWIVLLHPVVLWAARRPLCSTAALLAAGAALEVARLTDTPLIGAGPLRIGIGDACSYGAFAVLGAAWRLRPERRRPGAGRLAAVALGCAWGTMVWVRLVGVPTGVANDSYPLVVLLGGAWLAAVLALRPPVTALARTRWVAPAVRAINRRSVTVYLWHPAAIVAAAGVLPGGGPGRLLGRLALTAAGVVLAARLFGPVEDLAAGRSRLRRHPGRRPGRDPRVRVPVATAAAGLLLPIAFAVQGGDIVSTMTPPSDRAALRDDDFPIADGERAAVAAAAVTAASVDPARLQAAVDDWVAGRADVDAAEVTIDVAGAPLDGLGRPGVRGRLRRRRPLRGAVAHQGVHGHARAAGGGRRPRRPRRADAGAARRRPGRPAGHPAHAAAAHRRPRELHDGPRLRRDSPVLAGEAVSLSTAAPLRSAPGSTVHYANSGYVWLGLLLEAVRGEPYDALVGRLAAELGLAGTRVVDRSGPGWTPHASGPRRPPPRISCASRPRSTAIRSCCPPPSWRR